MKTLPFLLVSLVLSSLPPLIEHVGQKAHAQNKDAPEPLTLEGHASWVAAVAFSPDGKRVVSGDGENNVKLWDANTGKEVELFEGHEATVTSVAFTRDGKRIVSGSMDTSRPSRSARTASGSCREARAW